MPCCVLLTTDERTLQQDTRQLLNSTPLEKLLSKVLIYEQTLRATLLLRLNLYLTSSPLQTSPFKLLHIFQTFELTLYERVENNNFAFSWVVIDNLSIKERDDEAKKLTKDKSQEICFDEGVTEKR